MKTSDDFEEPPEDYHVIVPAGWFQLALDPEVRDRSIIALADRQFRGIDNASQLRKEFMRELQRAAKKAYTAGGTELYISMLAVGPIPLASSLLISVPPADEWPDFSDVDELAEFLADRPGPLDTAAELGVVELAAAGRAVRRRTKEAADPETQMGNTLNTTLLTYHVPIPATKRWLTLTFSTPLEPLADQLVELFDTVAGTLHWE
ncbi:hypothetical protein ACIQPQ_33650 [Streptomyces sp. NPDC091281]|uniref:hypothetical protein n=1 Tax=Streptomyces sp. NPDC091281 TaxID=3365985 RepID=UPI003824106B